MRARWIPLMLLAAVGCASGGGSATTSGDAGTPPRTQRDLITQAEIDATDVNTALDLIQRLRPEYMRPRGGASAGPVVFYLDNMKLSGPDQLQSVQRAAVREVRFLSATDASMRFGLDHMAGAVIVTTRR